MIKNLAIKLIQMAIITANEAMVRSLFLFCVICGLIFSASKVGFKESDIGIPLFRIFFFAIQVLKISIVKIRGGKIKR